jgi:transcriptional regulator with XRE-family HTH domain
MQPGEDVAAYGQVLAANVRAYRARADVTQQQLAGRMRQLGARWHYQTVGAVERGDRPLSAVEIPALAMALGTGIEELMMPPPGAREVMFGDQVIPVSRLSAIDGSVGWDADNRISVVANWQDRYTPEQLDVMAKALADWDASQAGTHQTASQNREKMRVKWSKSKRKS